jgi:hypothetical protein
MMFDRDVHEQALADIRQALAEEHLYESDAEMLAAIADDYDVPVEELIRVIHAVVPASNSIVAPFTRFCVDYKRAQEALRQRQQGEQPDLFAHRPEAF